MKKLLTIEIKALFKALILSLFLCLAVGSIVNLTSLSETLLAPLGRIVFILTVFYGAFYAARAYGSKGLIRGTNMGLLFFIIIHSKKYCNTFL